MDKKSLILTVFLFAICACSKRETPEEKGIGYLTLIINQSNSLKTNVEIMDFTLRITDGHLEVLRERIGDLPEMILLTAGTYTVEAYSMEFLEPMFDTFFYSGKTTVEIEADETKAVSLVCSQGNAGIKLVWDDDFSTLYSTCYARINGAEGYLHYSMDEARTGYFLPGTVTVSIIADGLTINGGSIMLAAGDMVTATLRPKEGTTPTGSLSIEIIIDDSVNERNDIEIIVDPDFTGSNSETNPYNIAQAIVRQGEDAVWITGYIVGSKPSAASNYDFVNPATWQATNIVLADAVTETDDYNCIFVELGSSGIYRTQLNLVNNPENLHRKILIKGNLRTYQYRPGLRDLAGYSFQ